MPRDQKFFCKYKCLQPGCRKIIRQDKWSLHCRKDHGYMHARGEDIKKDIVPVKDIYGKWKPQSSSQTNSPSTSLMPAGSNNDMRKSDDDIDDVVAKEYLPTEAAESNSNFVI
ncbi:hypothetical protein HELRODRAFT_165424 [Helobdella robusta]|uniref:Uncharacterized protein n=1 Tax=Helobdella robusta TaxID=6412 RepID=T1EWR7_HELRO|nr:hypothetical protein HELRODRAFT_165424 [Helobdella robusta]ESN91394.1 hypothetical protein HELRODRAFT_165424 [Helobdella robusta]